jgi:hypothetical protein
MAGPGGPRHREETALQKLTLDIDGRVTPAIPDPVFERGAMADGQRKVALISPPDCPELFRQLASLLPGPFFVLYVLHTPRGEAEGGRYQSPELSASDLDAFMARYTTYFAADARHDLWIYSLASRQTLVWDRHNLIYIEGDPQERLIEALEARGFSEGHLKPVGDHSHHYRAEFDDDAKSLLSGMDWVRTPLRPEDEQ